MKTNRYSPFQKSIRAALALFALYILPGNASADCYGCPTGSLEVVVHLKNGVSRQGLLEIHEVWVKELIDVRPFPADSPYAREISTDDAVELWQRSLIDRRVFNGPNFLLKYQDSSLESTVVAPSDDEIPFRYPLLVIEEPLRIPASEIAWIQEESSTRGQTRRMLGKPYSVDEETLAVMLGDPKSVVYVADRRDTPDGEFYGLSFLREIAPETLARICVENAGSFEIWRKEGIVCANWGGST